MENGEQIGSENGEEQCKQILNGKPTTSTTTNSTNNKNQKNHHSQQQSTTTTTGEHEQFKCQKNSKTTFSLPK